MVPGSLTWGSITPELPCGVGRLINTPWGSHGCSTVRCDPQIRPWTCPVPWGDHGSGPGLAPQHGVVSVHGAGLEALGGTDGPGGALGGNRGALGASVGRTCSLLAHAKAFVFGGRDEGQLGDQWGKLGVSEVGY